MITIKYIGLNKENQKGMLSLAIPFNQTKYYNIVSVDDIQNAKQITERLAVPDDEKGVLYCFCKADGENVVLIYERSFMYDKVKNRYFLTSDC